MISLYNGIDICSVDRISRTYAKFGDKFLDRIFTIQEKNEFKNKSVMLNMNYLAKRFAAKEAFSKALGEGIGNISFRDIEVLKDTLGAPLIKISKKLSDYLSTNKNWVEYCISLSMSDDKGFAIASVVILLLKVK